MSTGSKKGRSSVGSKRNAPHPDSHLAWLAGEHVAAKDSHVTYLHTSSEPVPGTLFVTNYRVAFVPSDPASAPVPHVSIAGGAIYKVEKFGGQSSRGDNAYGISISDKGFRELAFAFVPLNHSRKLIFPHIRKLAYPGGQERTAAFVLGHRPVSSGATWGSVYDPEKELDRLGVRPGNGWRVSHANKNFKLSPTYPAVFAVPDKLSDDDIAEAAKFRTKGRFALFSWRHPTNSATITRCSQPKRGLFGGHSVADEKLIASIVATNSQSTTLHIRDARPRLNVYGNALKGGGIESMSRYHNCNVEYCDIANIHVMRDSYNDLRELCLEKSPSSKGWAEKLSDTDWLEWIRHLLLKTVETVTLIEQRARSVLVHCSDGWDRTAQLTGLAMLCLDPYHRTMEGFCVLVAKEWIGAGHKFGQRIGHGSSNTGDSQRSPIFAQFMDAVWQISNQFPTSLEFNEGFLMAILDALYSCQYGNFLFNNDAARASAKLTSNTTDLWSSLLARKKEWTNSKFIPLDGVLYPSSSANNVTLWQNYYLRYIPHADTSSQKYSIRGSLTQYDVRASTVIRAASVRVTPSDSVSSDNMAALRNEVERLRTEVEELRAVNKNLGAELMSAKGRSRGGSGGSGRKRGGSGRKAPGSMHSKKSS